MTVADRTGEERTGEVRTGEVRAGEGSMGEDRRDDAQHAPRVLTPEAKRALEEAEARRIAQAAEPKPPREVGGRDGPDPTRFGDWEKGGITSDF